MAIKAITAERTNNPHVGKSNSGFSVSVVEMPVASNVQTCSPIISVAKGENRVITIKMTIANKYNVCTLCIISQSMYYIKKRRHKDKKPKTLCLRASAMSKNLFNC